MDNIEQTNSLGNIKIDGQTAIMCLSTRIYHPDAIKAAAYILEDRSNIFLDSPEKDKVLVELTAKDNQTIKEVIEEFNHQLLNYSVYRENSEKNRDLRAAILKRILLTNEIVDAITEIKREINDPEGIMQSWEEKNRQK